MQKNIHQILYNLVINYMNFYDKHIFKKLCKYTSKIDIIDLYNIDDKYSDRLDDSIINKYNNVVRLYVSTRSIISNVNHMTKLKELDISNSEIDNNGTHHLTSLEVLNASWNNKIFDINNMSNLKKLIILGLCGINNEGITKLTDLEILDVSSNNKISNINNLTKLTELNAGDRCGLTNDGIFNLTDLKILDVSNNSKITDINQMTKLTELNAGYKCGLANDGIYNLSNLENLDINYNNQINHISHLTKLTKVNY